MDNIKDFDKTLFWRLGAMKFSEEYDSLTKLTDVCTYDATLYNTNDPKKCMIRGSTSFRPHLVRHLNLLDDASRNWIQALWNKSNSYIANLGVTQYQCFLVITNNSFSVGKHSHGDHMGDTITVVSTLGGSDVDTYLCISDDVRIKYPECGTIKAVCFDGNIIHHTESNDKNYYFHFVYDLVETVDFTKNEWLDINEYR